MSTPTLQMTQIDSDEKLSFSDFKDYVLQFLKYEDLLNPNKGFNFVDFVDEWEIILKSQYDELTDIYDTDIIEAKNCFIDFIVFEQKVKYKLSDSNFRGIGLLLLKYTNLVIVDCDHNTITFKNVDSKTMIKLSLHNPIDVIEKYLSYLSKTKSLR